MSYIFHELLRQNMFLKLLANLDLNASYTLKVSFRISSLAKQYKK